MTGKAAKKSNLKYVLVALVILALPVSYAYYTFQDASEIAEGVVISARFDSTTMFTRTRARTTPFYTAAIKFHDKDGNFQVFTTHFNFRPPLSVGESVTVKYQPDAPAHAIIIGRKSLDDAKKAEFEL